MSARLVVDLRDGVISRYRRRAAGLAIRGFTRRRAGHGAAANRLRAEPVEDVAMWSSGPTMVSECGAGLSVVREACGSYGLRASRAILGEPRARFLQCHGQTASRSPATLVTRGVGGRRGVLQLLDRARMRRSARSPLGDRDGIQPGNSRLWSWRRLRAAIDWPPGGLLPFLDPPLLQQRA